MIDQIREELFARQDEKYRGFQCSLIPTVAAEAIIGVRTPELRALARKLRKNGEISLFLNDLPHRYFEENQLHAFLISGVGDFERCRQAVDHFLPWVDNWATCDQMSPKVFSKHRQELVTDIERWLSSGRTYTIRFGIKMLMEHYLDADFDVRYPEMVAAVRSEEYYVKMMIAWYFATALAKQYDAALPYLKEHRLDVWAHNKTIQKAVESFRIPPEHKEILKSMRRKA